MNSGYISSSPAAFLSFTHFSAGYSEVNLSAHFAFSSAWVFFTLRSIINFLNVSLSVLALDVLLVDSQMHKVLFQAHSHLEELT